MDTTVRVLTLLGLLQDRRFWTGQELADALGVTTRCVRRDMQRLRDLGYPVHASGGVGGGYTLGAGTDLPPLPLAADEAVAVAVGLRAAANGVVSGMQEPALRALAKLEVVLPKEQRRRLTALEAASQSLARPGVSVDSEVLVALALACRESVQTTFHYTARSGETSKRRVHPVRLVHSEVRWYLLAWDLVREGWRTFRLDRIESVVAQGRLPFRAPPAEDVAGYVEERLSRWDDAVQSRVRIRAPAEVVRERVGRGAVEPDGPDCCWLRGGSDFEGTARWLAWLGFELLEAEPAELRQALKRLADNLRVQPE